MHKNIDKLAAINAANNYESVVNNISQGILLLDFTGTILIYNWSAESILHKKRQDVLFQNFWAHFDDMLFGFSIKGCLAHRHAVWTQRATLSGGNINNTRTIESDASFMPQGMIISIRDINHLLHMEALKRKSNQAKELQEMAAMIAHEVRNPLGGIKGFACLLRRDLSEQPSLQRLANYIEQGITNLETTVNDVLNHYHHLHLSKSDLVQLIGELLMHIKADASIDSRIKLESKFSTNSIMAVVDPLALKSALLNLCSNAIKAMPQGGILCLEVDENQAEICIKVIDTGDGITTENLKNLFTPFFTTRDQGHGFGLSEVQEIVQAHHGHIDVFSEVGKGTTFSIRIPKKQVSNEH